MKITIICDVFGQENNGTTITIKRLMDGLVARGHQVKMVSPYTDENSTNPKFYTVPKRTFGIFTKYVKKNGVELGKPDKTILRKAIEGSDVVHLALPFKMCKASIKICNELNIPFTTAFHCQPENFSSHLFLKNSMLFNNFLYQYYNNTFYKFAKYIHCPTRFIANELEKHKYKAKMFVISNGVISTYHKMACEKPEELKDKFCILFIGRLSREKRHDLLIKAMKYSKYADNIQLIFAGCGPLEKKLKKMGQSLKNSPIIRFFQKEELVKVINFCDLYCHPSDVEIEAISCIEALTCGKTALISNSSKSATRFFAQDERCKFLAGDAKNLAQKIDYFIENPQENAKIGEKCEKFAEIFKIDNAIDEMVKMFETAKNEHKQGKIVGLEKHIETEKAYCE